MLVFIDVVGYGHVNGAITLYLIFIIFLYGKGRILCLILSPFFMGSHFLWKLSYLVGKFYELLTGNKCELSHCNFDTYSR